MQAGDHDIFLGVTCLEHFILTTEFFDQGCQVTNVSCGFLEDLLSDTFEVRSPRVRFPDQSLRLSYNTTELCMIDTNICHLDRVKRPGVMKVQFLCQASLIRHDFIFLSGTLELGWTNRPLEQPTGRRQRPKVSERRNGWFNH